MATYKIKGTRYLRKYTATSKSPVYAASVDAKKAAESMCDLAWERSPEADAQMSYHTEDRDEDGVSGLDKNVMIRDRLDAALFCAEHVGGTHRAYANAACYVFKLPELPAGQSYPRLESCSIQVVSDPYNSAGTRIALHTNATGEIPVACAEVRTGAVHASGVAKRTERTIDGAVYWYPTYEECELRPEGGMALERYIMVVVALENYSVVRGNWLEGSSYIDPVIEIAVDGEITGWGDGSDDVVADAGAAHEFNVARGGEYQSVDGAVSGVYGVEVLETGDRLDDMVLRRGGVPSEKAFGCWFDGAFQGLRGSNGVRHDGNASISCGLVPSRSSYLETGGDHWFQYILVWGDSPLFDQDYNIQNSQASKLIRIVDPADMATFQSISVPSMTQEDLDAGVACAYLEGTNSALRYIYIYTNNGVLNKCLLSRGTYGWTSHSGTTTSPADNRRETGVSVPVCMWGGSPVFKSSDSFFGMMRTYSSAGFTFEIYGTRDAVLDEVWPYSLRSCSLPVQGTVTSEDVLVVAGGFHEVNGKYVKNCIIFTRSGDGSVSFGSPAWADEVTPDTYEGFCITPVSPRLVDAVTGESENTGGYVVTGRFTKLSGVPYPGCAFVTADGEVRSMDALRYEGWEMCSIDSMVLLANGDKMFAGMAGPVEDVYRAEIVDRAVSVAAIESCIGLRSLYARLYKGEIMPVGSEAAGYARAGAGFAVSRVVRDVFAASGLELAEKVSLAVYRMSLSALAVPFSVPVAYNAKKVRVDWPDWAGTTTGGKVNVWLKRGDYLREMPDNVLRDPDIYIGGETVSGWEWLGSIDAVSAGSETSKVFELEKPLTDRLATLMFTAFVDMDSVNPGRDMTLPHGVATEFSADVENGSVEGKESLFEPDITLLG